MKKLFISLFLVSFSLADETFNHNITRINVRDSGLGETTITNEILEECLSSIPNVDALQPTVNSESEFIKGINGNTSDNQWVRKYSANLDITYMLRQKELIQVTIKSINGKDPIFKEVFKNFPQVKSFTSNPENGDSFGGRSNRKYFFTKPETAEKDVKDKAKAWLNQQASVVCKE